MSGRFTLRQRAALRRMEARWAAEDPDLSLHLRGDLPVGDPVLRLGWWSPLTLVILGGLFMVCGAGLDVGSSFMFGLALCTVAALRHQWLHRPAGRDAFGVKASPEPWST